MTIAEKIKRVLSTHGFDFKERGRTIHTTCPLCGQDDKLSILKDNGATICYRDSNHLKGWFEDWMVESLGVTYSEARKQLHGPPPTISEEEFLAEDDAVETQKDIGPQPVQWPPENCYDLSFDECKKGLTYLESRGVSLEVAQKYGIVYNLRTERVVIPILIDGQCYGWQGRAVNDVHKNDRMRNNEGFRRDKFVMFRDLAAPAGFVIICEGPFDAIKFDKVGGNIATMGKVITDGQIAMIESMHPERVYAALDEDAPNEAEKLYQRFGSKLYVVQIPQSAHDRCAAQGRKADFGECTYEECVQAIESAFQMSDNYLF